MALAHAIGLRLLLGLRRGLSAVLRAEGGGEVALAVLAAQPEGRDVLNVPFVPRA